MKRIAFTPTPLLLGLLAALALNTPAVQAQSASPVAKTLVVEPAQVFPSFERWVTAVSVAAQETPPAQLRVFTIQIQELSAAAPQPASNFQPAPVILGVPDLPLLGEAGSQVSRWSSTFNYQGVSLRQVVLDASGRRLESRPMGKPLRPGERFKLRITPSFDSVADVDQVRGDVWFGQRVGQVYPQTGMSVELRAGQTVDLPLDPNEYFVMDRWNPTERLVLSVRHARALDAARSTQPAYRQDTARSSSYLQLVPSGQYPAIEQLIFQAR
jgi:hypothetical protein